MLLYLIIISFNACFNLPFKNTKFKNNLNFPFIGTQNIELIFINNSTINVNLEGIINEKGTVKLYNFNNNPQLKLSYNLKKTLLNWNSELNINEYNDNEININLKINKFKINKNIKLLKQENE